MNKDIIFIPIIYYMNKLLQKALSDEDITKFLKGKVNIVRYRDIKNYDSVFDVMGPNGKAIILIEAKGTNHWVSLCIIKPPNKKEYVLFQDSYGMIPCNEFNYIPRSFQKLTNQNRNVLLQKLIDCPIQVHYNQHRLQKLSSFISTCGRWASLRCYYNTLTEDEFAKVMKSGIKDGITTDELCCLLFEDIKQKNE